MTFYLQHCLQTGVYHWVCARNPKGLTRFFKLGGKIEFAVDQLLRVTEQVLTNGDDGWMLDDFEDEYELLLSTELDEAFDIAWTKCMDADKRDERQLQVMRGPWFRMYESPLVEWDKFFNGIVEEYDRNFV